MIKGIIFAVSSVLAASEGNNSIIGYPPPGCSAPGQFEHPVGMPDPGKRVARFNTGADFEDFSASVKKDSIDRAGHEKCVDLAAGNQNEPFESVKFPEQHSAQSQEKAVRNSRIQGYTGIKVYILLSYNIRPPFLC